MSSASSPSHREAPRVEVTAGGFDEERSHQRMRYAGNCLGYNREPRSSRQLLTENCELSDRVS